MLIVEAIVAFLLKSTLATATPGWAILIYEGDWTTAVVALLPLVLCGLLLRHHSHRLRGKRAEGSP